MSEQPTSLPSLRVTRLSESNFKRIISANIQPGNRTLVVLQGPNEHGKTSTLDGLIATLGGKKADPEQPVHTGADHASVEVELSDAIRARYKIVKSWKAGKAYLNVYAVAENGEASKCTGPQTLLDSLVSDLSFDPLAFAKLASSNRAEDKAKCNRMLFAAIGRPDVPEKVKARKTVITEERRQINQRIDQVKAGLAANPDPIPGQELKPVTDDDLRQQMQQAEQHNEALRVLSRKLDEYANKAHAAKIVVDDIDRQIAALQQRRVSAESEIKENQDSREKVLTQLQAMPPAISTEQLTAGLAQIRDHNRKCEQQQNHRTKAAELKNLQAQADAKTAELADVDAKVEKLLAESDLCHAVQGLAYVDGEFKHNNVPLSQASGMRRLEISALIGMAANPALRILCIDEGDQLDDASIKRLIELAKSRDYSVWMTAIRAGDEHDPDTHLVPVNNGIAVDKATGTPGEQKRACEAIAGTREPVAAAMPEVKPFDPGEL